MATYLGLLVALFSTVFLPVPEEAVLVGIGWLAREGTIGLAGGWAVAWIGILGGDVLTFGVGRTLGRGLLESRLARFLPRTLLPWAERVVRAHRWRAVILARFLVALRGPVYLAIGAAKMPLRRFLLLDGTVALVEIGVFVLAGFAWHAAPREAKWIDVVAGVVLAAILLGPALGRRILARRAART